MKKTLGLLTAFTLTTSLVGCGVADFTALTGGDKSVKAQAKKRGAKKWTIMVHLAADNNLYRFGLEDVNEMEAGLASDDVNVIVLFDGIKDGDSAILKVERDPAGMNSTWVSKPVDDKGAVIPASKEIDSGSTAVATKFATWTAENFPAEHYMLAYWDHGNGIFANGGQFFNKGFAWDDKGTHMGTNALSTILPAFKQAAGKNLDILGFDACLMAHVELAYQAKGNADYLVASEELEPGAGWAYHDWLSAVSKTDKSPKAVASALVDSFGRSYAPGGSQNSSGRQFDITLSATDINAMTAQVVPAMNKLAGSLTAALPTHKAAIANARKNTESYDNRDCADLGHFTKAVMSENLPDNVKADALAVQRALGNAIVREVHTGKTINVGVKNASGLVVYFPQATMTYNARYSDPKQILFANEGWKDFLIPFTQK